MNYEVHISRRKDWFDEDAPCILEEEWRAYVASDPEMTIPGGGDPISAPGGARHPAPPLVAEWRRPSLPSSVTFTYFGGVITVKDPDEACFVKMREIAAKLRARVQGDDREYYDGPLSVRTVRRGKAWLRKLFGR